ncbi:hypothetical protein ACQP00_36185 [Dactylosporangium sp. CS-047395]|uniref:hypothetical protein n=1 Tax=Dactylosporangium sp. CS-047395 TaxID=3239936 RepID=UPI003D8E1EAB
MVVAVIAAPRAAKQQPAEAGRLVDPALRAALDSLPSSTRHIAGYHFGWWDPGGGTARADAGQALRARPWSSAGRSRSAAPTSTP